MRVFVCDEVVMVVIEMVLAVVGHGIDMANL